MALLWPLFVRSVWAQTATVVAGTAEEAETLTYVRSVVVGSACDCGSLHDRLGS